MNLISVNWFMVSIDVNILWLNVLFTNIYLILSKEPICSEPLSSPLLAVEDHQYYIFNPKS